MGIQRNTDEVQPRKNPSRKKPNAPVPKPTPATTSKAKGKRIVTEEEETEVELSDQEAEGLVLGGKGKGKASARDKGKGKAVPNDPRPFTVQQCRARFKEVTFEGTRFPDYELLDAMGIREDVETIFENLGLRQFMSQVHDTYEDLAQDFFTTLDVKLNDPDYGESDEILMLKFKTKGKEYIVRAPDLFRAYGLPMGMYHHIDISTKGPEKLWNLIGEGYYKNGRVKAANIRHPALRYVHKALAHTLVQRGEKGNFTKEDMGYIMVGIKPLLTNFMREMKYFANRRDVSMVAIFAKLLSQVKKGVMATSGKARVEIGGLLTPLFMHLGIDLTGKVENYTTIDRPYCLKFGFIAGTIGDKIAYKYRDDLLKRVLLPQTDLTSIQKEENIAFKLSEEHWHDRRKHGPIKKSRAQRGLDDEGDEEEDEDERQHPPNDSVYGSARYNFVPYGEEIKQPALREAHEHIHLLQRLVKWQGRTIKKVVKQVVGLTKEVKSLKEKLSGGGCSSSRRDDVMDTVMEHHEEEAQDMRHSFHGISTPTDQEEEPSRASSFEPRQRRRKRRAARSPTPPGPTSSNESYSFGSNAWY